MSVELDIFAYSDYRVFLTDYYKAKKRDLPGFTFDVLAKRGGFSSASFPKLVIDGKRNLTNESTEKMIVGLRLKPKAARYFKILVDFNQAELLEDKVAFLKKIDAFRKKNSPEHILPDEYDYLKKWYHPVIREMTELPTFKEDPEWIGKRLVGKVGLGEISLSLEFLIKSGFLQRDNHGKLFKKDKTLATGKVSDKSIHAAIAKNFHLNMISHAKEAVDKLPKEQRNVSNVIFSLSKESYQAALERINQLNLEILELAKSDKHVEDVYGLNINLFPLTQDKGS